MRPDCWRVAARRSESGQNPGRYGPILKPIRTFTRTLCPDYLDFARKLAISRHRGVAIRTDEMKTIKDMPEHARPREKLREKGPSALADDELVAAILGGLGWGSGHNK